MKRNSDRCRQDSERVLLVEGKNDCHVVMALCGAYNVPELFTIYECGQDYKVLKRLNALIAKSDPPEVIGVMIDADNPSLASRWDSIRDKLNQHQKHGYSLPESPDPNGTILESTSDGPNIGFWLMPNNKDSGMLEDFCASLAEPASLAFAKECVDKASEQKQTTYQETHYSKAIIHTYLAWQDTPGAPLGLAITKQALRPDTATAKMFKDWLVRLFDR